MARVLQMDSELYDAAVADSHQTAIYDQLQTYDSMYDGQVNDGTDMDGQPTLGIHAAFDSATDANAFHAWLQDYVAQYADDWQRARVRVHDCMHADDQNEPCKIGDVRELV